VRGCGVHVVFGNQQPRVGGRLRAVESHDQPRFFARLVGRQHRVHDADLVAVRRHDRVAGDALNGVASDLLHLDLLPTPRSAHVLPSADAQPAP
jgi:hypothetical protein